jgi:hypothetical protein
MFAKSSVAYGPPGPVHANVNGPAEPLTVRFIAPLKGATQRLLGVTTLDKLNVGAVFATLMLATAVHPLGTSVTITLYDPS